jgi:hypothetical protein
MYSPKINKHTQKIYRISRAFGKPMTKVADDLISFGFQHLKSIYVDIDDLVIEKSCTLNMPQTFGEKDKLAFSKLGAPRLR